MNIIDETMLNAVLAGLGAMVVWSIGKWLFKDTRQTFTVVKETRDWAIKRDIDILKEKPELWSYFCVNSIGDELQFVLFATGIVGLAGHFLELGVPSLIKLLCVPIVIVALCVRRITKVSKAVYESHSEEIRAKHISDKVKREFMKDEQTIS